MSNTSPLERQIAATSAALIEGVRDLAAERDALAAQVAALRSALGMTAEMSRMDEIPEGYGPEPNPEFDRGYDAAISLARAALQVDTDPAPDGADPATLGNGE